MLFYVQARALDTPALHLAGAVLVTGLDAHRPVVSFVGADRTFPGFEAWADVEDGIDLLSHVAALAAHYAELVITPDAPIAVTRSAPSPAD